MAFTDILWIKTKLDDKDLRAMEKSLQSRFKKLAKGFGKSITEVFKGGGLFGMALGLIDKLLNPLQSIQESIDRMLQKSDDLAVNAKQFATDTGTLFRLGQLAKTKGLDNDQLFMLMNKFQTAVAQAKKDPNDDSVSSVRNFTNQPDTAKAFFAFIQSLQSMEKNQQLLVQQQIFGEKQILKMAEFLQTTPQEFADLIKQTGLDKGDYAKSIDAMSTLADLNDVLAVRRENKDVLRKGSTINEGMIRARDKSESIALERENQQIANYQNLAAISDTTNKIMELVDKGVGMLGGLINVVTTGVNKITEGVNALLKSPAVRGIKSWFGKGE